ncbi:SH3 domain-containing protein [Streptomyces zingiberis]|uniref:SH3 domain-containing protein n=1 Tax=Streptomyces zingiberis TaxID=2053010 RepID=UPI001F0D2268|nr:SH3 domain-containing protein [Streptomyces zingiberis]
MVTGTVALALLGAFFAAPAHGRARDAAPASGVDVPAEVTAGIAVFDRRTGTFTARVNADHRFRSASIVKLLLALDVLRDLAPAYDIPGEERARLEAMLRSSDDDQASHYWAERGGSAIIGRMASRLGLTGTAPPPATHPGFWGYTALTAADTVRIYRYILDEAPVPVREFIMGNLRRATRCANDGFDQYFGIPSAFDGPWAAKQGWSGFTSGGCTADAGTPAPAVAAPARGGERTPDGDAGGPRGADHVRDGNAVNHAAGADQPGGAGDAAGSGGAGAAPADGGDPVDLVREALHTTGTVGRGDRAIVAVLTLHPDGTPYGTAYSRLTRIAGSLEVPGVRRPSGTWVPTRGEGVRVRAAATTSSAVVTTLPAGVEVLVSCLRRGQWISDPPHAGDRWAYLPQYRGYVTTVHLGAGNGLPDVPDCS